MSDSSSTASDKAQIAQMEKLLKLEKIADREVARSLMRYKKAQLDHELHVTKRDFIDATREIAALKLELGYREAQLSQDAQQTELAQVATLVQLEHIAEREVSKFRMLHKKTQLDRDLFDTICDIDETTREVEELNRDLFDANCRIDDTTRELEALNRAL
jgi:hypothetical protein